MGASHYLLDVVGKQKAGIPQGVCSICSANEFVITAALEHAKKKGIPVLLESTSNQVNQFGGYTGMTPVDFRNFVFNQANKVGFPQEKLILGGDHLGPNPWQEEAADTALEKACVSIRDYVQAGFSKIHLDASMYLGDDEGDRNRALDPKIVAERTALLCQAAEEGYQELLKQNSQATAPVYVIGSEVPVPGGTTGDDGELSVTKSEDFVRTVALTKTAFLDNGLEGAWERVIGVVVQPGVEFGDHTIHEYNPEEAFELSQELKQYDQLVFEGHSTDYQQPDRLKQMVKDGVAILKVGPELTFMLREALFLLHHIEQELCADWSEGHSDLINVLEKVMLEQPQNWKPYYRGSEQELKLARKYSLSDRIRYYWPQPEVAQAVTTLLNNLKQVDLPLTMLSQYFPLQTKKVRAGELAKEPEAIIKDRIAEIYDKYFEATQP